MPTLLTNKAISKKILEFSDASGARCVVGCWQWMITGLITAQLPGLGSAAAPPFGPRAEARMRGTHGTSPSPLRPVHPPQRHQLAILGLQHFVELDVQLGQAIQVHEARGHLGPLGLVHGFA